MKQYRENAKRGTENFPFAYYKESYTNHMIRLHWHPEIELTLVLSGEIKYCFMFLLLAAVFGGMALLYRKPAEK